MTQYEIEGFLGFLLFVAPALVVSILYVLLGWLILPGGKGKNGV